MGLEDPTGWSGLVARYTPARIRSAWWDCRGVYNVSEKRLSSQTSSEFSSQGCQMSGCVDECVK